MSELKSYNVCKDDFFEVIVIGGGTCGLAASARLCEDYPGSIYTEDEHQRFRWLKQRGNKVNLINHNVSSKTKYKPPTKDNSYTLPKKYKPLEILVLDTVSDRFLGQWDNQFSKCQIPYLRSPMFFHPDPVNIDGLVTYSHFTNRQESDLMKIENVVGKEYSKHQLKKLIAKNSRKKQSKNPIPLQEPGKISDKPGLIDINMRDWKDYYRPSTPLFRDFCTDIIDRYQLNNIVKKEEVISLDYGWIDVLGTNETGKGFIVTTSSGKTFGCKICVLASGHAGEINYPIKPFQSNSHYPEGSCHTTHIFSGSVNFPEPRVMEKVQQKRSNSVVIVGGGLTSAQLAHVSINSGVEKVYMILRGPLKIKHFDFHLDWVTKYKNVKKSAFYVKDTDRERYEMIQEAREGGSVNPEYYKKLKGHIKSGKLELLKFSNIEKMNWKEESKTWDLEVKTKLDNLGFTSEDTVSLSDVDYIYFATGIKPNIKSLPLLKQIVEKYDIDTVEGFPCLTDNLQWNNEIPLFVIGKNASLRMGPSSANLDGARLGAERIGWYIQEMKSQGYFDWCSKECQFCSYQESYSSDDNSLDGKLDERSTISDKELTSFETQLKLACGELNWFSLLQEV